MNKHFLIWDNPRDALLNITFILMIIGCVNVFSASFVRADAMFKDSHYFLKRYLMWSAIGLFCMWVVGFKLDYKIFLTARFTNILVWIAGGLLLGVDLFGAVVNGSRRWLSLGGLSLQPSELAKAVEVIWAASYLGHYMKRGLQVSLTSWPSNKGLWIAVVFAAFIYKQPDMATMTITFGVMMVMYFLAGIPRKQVTTGLGIAVVGLAFLAVIAPYRMQRFLSWGNPWKDPQGAGYQMAQSLLAIGSGGFVGLPWGQGTSKFFYLPEAHTDFAFAIFCQEWGFIGALALIAAFVILAWSLVRIAWSTKEMRGFLLVAGITCLMVGQAAANMAMVCGVLPVIGVPLMFISYGGTSMVINMTCLGLVLSVYRSECKRELMEERIAQGLPPEEKPGVRVVKGQRGGRRS